MGFKLRLVDDARDNRLLKKYALRNIESRGWRTTNRHAMLPCVVILVRLVVSLGAWDATLCFSSWWTAAGTASHRSQSNAVGASRGLGEGRGEAPGALSRDPLTPLDWVGRLIASATAHRMM